MDEFLKKIKDYFPSEDFSLDPLLAMALVLSIANILKKTLDEYKKGTQIND